MKNSHLASFIHLCAAEEMKGWGSEVLHEVLLAISTLLPFPSIVCPPAASFPSPRPGGSGRGRGQELFFSLAPHNSVPIGMPSSRPTPRGSTQRAGALECALLLDHVCWYHTRTIATFTEKWKTCIEITTRGDIRDHNAARGQLKQVEVFQSSHGICRELCPQEATTEICEQGR